MQTLINSAEALSIVLIVVSAISVMILIGTILWFKTRSKDQLNLLFINPDDPTPQGKSRYFYAVCVVALILILAILIES